MNDGGELLFTLLPWLLTALITAAIVQDTEPPNSRERAEGRSYPQSTETFARLCCRTLCRPGAYSA
jgi:hypothetical protein